ncbi:hypothetical protein D0Y65_019967, partial [Glycine soja]
VRFLCLSFLIIWSGARSRCRGFPCVVPLGCEATLFIRLFSFSFPKLLGGLRMYFAVTIKRYQAVKEVGQIKMSVGVIGYNQLMLVCQAEYFRQLLKPVT